MSTTDTNRATITQYTDPMCTWCWGSEPIVRRLRAVYGDQIRFEYVMGGLVEDFESFYDAANDISDPSDVAPHWLEASETHGMPVNTDVFASNPAQSTYPASVAFAAAREQDRERAHEYLRGLRERYITQARNVNERDEQIALAEAVGFDIEQFVETLEEGTARTAFQADLEETRNAGVQAFPTYEIEGPDGQRRATGFQSFRKLTTALEAVTPGLDQRSPPPVEAFVREFGPVATQEVAELYELSQGKARQTLQSLADDGVLRRESRGNGLFWHAGGEH